MRTLVFNNKPLTACYGCRACEQICSHKAIVMVYNEEGFLYPQINTEKCVDCGLCEKVCPTQENNIDPLFYGTPAEGYAMWNKCLNERLESTSGGAYYLLASEFIDDGGIVYGVGYREDLTAYHQRVKDKDELKLLRGSKYMQSDINTTFHQVREDLKSGEKVLFSGTPCQIAGLRLFLRKNYENLYTIDLVCHGVPSPFIFKEHKKYLENKYKDKLIDFKFRSKKHSGWRSYAQYVFKNKKPVSVFFGDDYYCHAFTSGYLNRESCFTCDFSRSARIGDITLSDFWNAEKHSKVLKRQRKYGFNLIMCNTEKGQSLLEHIATDTEVELQTYPIQIAIDGDVRLRHTEERPSFRGEAYKICKERGYDYMVNTYGVKKTVIQKLLPTWIKNLIREFQSCI